MIVRKIEGSPGNTVRVAGVDTAANLADAIIYKDGTASDVVTNIAQELLITVEDNKIRFAFNGIAPTQTGSKVGHELGVGKSLMLRGFDQIRSFKHINDANGVNGVMQVTPFYSGQ